MIVCASPERGSICPADLYLATLESPRSRDNLGNLLRALTALWPRPAGSGCPWHQPTYADLVRLWAIVQTRGLSVRTRRLYRCAIRGVLRQSYHLGTITADEMLRLYDAVPLPHGQPAPAGRALSVEDVRELIDAVETEHTLRHDRDRAVLATLYATGIRAGELCGLRDPEDMREDGHVLAVRGKGDRPRLAFVADPVAYDYLTAWRHARGPEVGWLFCALRTEAFVDPSTPLLPRQVERIVAVAAERAGIGHVTPHDLRRTYATLLADRIPLDVLSRLLGHASIETTRAYVRRDEGQLQHAAALLPPLNKGGANEPSGTRGRPFLRQGTDRPVAARGGNGRAGIAAGPRPDVA